MLYSDIVPLIYVKDTICMVLCPSSRFKLILLWPKMNHLEPRLSQNTSYGWGAWCHPKFWDIPFFHYQTAGNYITSSWRLAGDTLSALFWCLYQKLSLSPLYLNKTLLHKSSEWSSFVFGPGLNSSPLVTKNPSVVIQQQPLILGAHPGYFRTR